MKQNLIPYGTGTATIRYWQNNILSLYRSKGLIELTICSKYVRSYFTVRLPTNMFYSKTIIISRLILYNITGTMYSLYKSIIT